MRIARRAGLAVAICAAVAAVAGCGTTTGSVLTRGAATQLSAELDQASTALDQYNCQVADAALTNFRNDVDQLQGVNATLVQMLTAGASTIDQLANDRCPNGSTTQTTTTTATATKTTGTATTVTTGTTTTTPSSTVTSTTGETTTSDSGGVAPTTSSATTPAVTTPPVTTTPPAPATTPDDSGGAGLNGASPSGGTGVGGTGQ